MSTVIRSEISEKSPYYIPKHRYYELMHFCLQYGDFKRRYGELVLSPKSVLYSSVDGGKRNKNLTEDKAIELSTLKNNIDIIEEAANKADKVLSSYILIGVTEGRSYPYLQTVKNIPCCRTTYYELYRKFFYILDKLR